MFPVHPTDDGCVLPLSRYAMMKRTEIRERFGIKGDGCGDCCSAYWCGCCVLIQNEKEVLARQSSGPITQGYQQQQGMQVPH